MIHFAVPESLKKLGDEVRRFVIEEIVPYERDPRLTVHGPNNELRTELVGLARKGRTAYDSRPPREYGGRGPQGSVEQSVWSTRRQAGQPSAPVAHELCRAPDEGNMFLLK